MGSVCRFIDLRPLPEVRRQKNAIASSRKKRGTFQPELRSCIPRSPLASRRGGSSPRSQCPSYCRRRSSVEALLSELEIGYSAQLAGRDPELPSFARAVPGFLPLGTAVPDSGSCGKIFAQLEPPSCGAAPLGLYTDHPRPDVPTFRGRTQHYRLDKELTAQLIALSRLGGTTLFMLMCALSRRCFIATRVRMTSAVRCQSEAMRPPGQQMQLHPT